MSRRIIFVTGGAGFIGSNIVARLAEDRSLDVVVCDRLREADLGKWRNLSKHAIGDFVAPGDMFDWLEKRWRDVEAVVHMGAISSTMETDADQIIQTNFGLSRDLYRWCADRQRRFVYASSAATYGHGAQGFEDQDDFESLAALRPLNAYGWSKALFDVFAARQAAREYAPPQWAGLKFFNVYGPNEGHKGPMRSVATQIWPSIRDGQSVQLFKSYREGVPDGGQKRDFVYVRDVADVVAWLLASPEVNGVFNLGSGKARTFEDLARAVFAAAGKPERIDYIPMPAALRDRYQYFTEARMQRLAEAGYSGGFTTLEAGIEDYVRGFLATDDPYR
ncbi:MAG: ADP-glyceromanno-heptose 6-epimerase [Phenylobacterium sp.]|uniref:ADP-glyceromanno-heptose 6-epimerase n=1 Tax=Phenylobacterium sp. TaxID=1871053 RepID=UPI0025E21B03|nr:ADP-glyceromanno-heptose 6-epimerase [Phenylobacterium sp.]MCA6227170.1 ADP-glyceromanno-heptose 6-epimerase [Phenylobacterium sp.]MCA6233115.1 ADP-glyceromanno-heptose 6-epimerase [Phenylobacterium sp.]MCA6234816.1 ADP-glyceromanno-heptose 6-epimerase [Phenylobacterium sp.]MCA6248824.1 ADP-glyceromanno-heptose 6-epimerase [Phenylobacterium sp.]MCA6252709.1 ADP-glyceromanno-heptose 6-epimerase [Phenylobacterium sp.]